MERLVLTAAPPRAAAEGPRVRCRFRGGAARHLPTAANTVVALVRLPERTPVELLLTLGSLRCVLADPRARDLLSGPPAGVCSVRIGHDLDFDLRRPDGLSLWRLLVSRLSARTAPVPQRQSTTSTKADVSSPRRAATRARTAEAGVPSLPTRRPGQVQRI